MRERIGVTTDAALLALVVGDADSIRVLAAWAALERPLADIDSAPLVDEVSTLASVSPTRARGCLRRLHAARCLVDGGITELADKMLQTFVGAHLGPAKKGKR